MSDEERSKLTTVGVKCIDPTMGVQGAAGITWAVGMPVPGKDGTKITEMAEIGGQVHVVAKPALHVTLVAPSLAMIVNVGANAAWTEAQQSVLRPEEEVTEVYDTFGGHWEVGKGVTVAKIMDGNMLAYENDATMTVERMVMVDGAVEVYAKPAPGTDFAKGGVAFQFILMPLTVQRVYANLNGRLAEEVVASWQAILERLEEEAYGDDDEIDPETLGEDLVPMGDPIMAAAAAAMGQQVPQQVPQQTPTLPVEVEAPPPPNGATP